MSRLFRSVEGRELFPNGSVVCIGAFDGLHLGHRALVRHAVARARALGVAAVAVAFEPLPREFFAQGTPPPRLTLARSKVEILRELGVDAIGLLRFDAAMAAMPAETFVRQLLVHRLGAREVWIGPEFCFGNRRRGDLALLQEMGAEWASAPARLKRWTCMASASPAPASASCRRGDFARANDLLGRPYAISGRVVRGRQLGRTLGFPTANLRFPKTPALSGICNLGARRVRPAVAVGVQLRHPADSGRRGAAAGGPPVRFPGRPVRAPHREFVAAARRREIQ